MSSDVYGTSITACENWKGKGIVKKLFPEKKIDYNETKPYKIHGSNAFCQP